MKLHRVQIHNFRNFQHLDVMLGDQAVIIGENKIGKSNFVHALRLILDPTLPDSARQLQSSDFWDGLGDILTKDHVITISVELTDFDDSEYLLAVLADYLICAEPMISSLTYTFRPVPGKKRIASEADYEFIVYGGDRPENRIGYDVRSRIPIEVMPALRDAERDLSNWNNSPLRPLLDEASKQLDRDHMQTVSDRILQTQNELLDTPLLIDDQTTSGEPANEGDGDHGEPQPGPPLRELEKDIATRLSSMVGNSEALATALGFSPTDPNRLLRSIRLFIDGGRRNISDASLGSANLIYLTLKSLFLDYLVKAGLRDHSFLAIEEPEAHLHPHLQRLVYRDFLQKRSHLGASEMEHPSDPDHQTIILTTHSPHIVSVSPLRSIVLLKKSPEKNSTIAVSTAATEMKDDDIDDIERYLDVKRGEVMFAKGIIFVEGDAEEYLVPVFAQQMGHDLDEMGVTVCSVSGTNFAPYVKLFSPKGLGLPFVVLTDRDPQEGGKNLGVNRALRLLSLFVDPATLEGLDDNQVLTQSEESGIYLNKYTFEVDMFREGAHEHLCATILDLTENSEAKKRAKTWMQSPDKLNEKQYLQDITAIGKGRFAQRLATRVTEDDCPEYIRNAIENIVSKCK